MIHKSVNITHTFYHVSLLPSLFSAIIQIGKKVVTIPVSEAKKRANKKWQDNNCKRVQLVLPNEEADIIEDYCKTHNLSKNGFFRQAAQEKIERDN